VWPWKLREMLKVQDLHAYYQKSHVLQGVDMHIGKGEVVALLGRNGVGRSTFCKSIMGQVVSTGSIRFGGQEITGLAPHQIACLGIGYVPETRNIFAGLTTRQNLMLGVKPRQKTRLWSPERLFELFPNLEERADVDASLLSGGEQQMLTIGRTLMGDPELILIDEPTEGLSPIVARKVADLIEKIRQGGVSIVLVEQKLAFALNISSRVYVMGHGRMVFSGDSRELMKRKDIRMEWLEV
jgi:branched-chain amino acid transport system ATP-binding protein